MTRSPSLRTTAIFLLGDDQNLISQNEQEQEAKTNKILEELGLGTSRKHLIRKDEDLAAVDVADVDIFVIFPCCSYRFTPLIRIATSGIPTLIVGSDEMFSCAADTYAYLASNTNVELAFSNEEFRAKLRALEIARWVKNARIVVFGVEQPDPESAWFKNSVGQGKLNTLFIGKDKVVEAYGEVSIAEAESLAREWTAECILREPTFEDVVLSAKAYLCLKALIEENNADAAYVLWCGQFTSGFGTKPCFALAKIADNIVPVGCWRGDNLLPTLILNAVTEEPVFVCELHGHQHENNILELRHCFCPITLSLAKPVLRPWRNMPHTVTAYCQLPRRTATLVNAGIGDKILITKALVTDCEDLEGDNCRITIHVQLPDQETIHKLQSVEFALVYGDHVNEVKEVARRLGIQIL